MKGDYIAALVDIIREQNGNDYLKVAVVLETAVCSQSKSKGFGGAA